MNHGTVEFRAVKNVSIKTAAILYVVDPVIRAPCKLLRVSSEELVGNRHDRGVACLDSKTDVGVFGDGHDTSDDGRRRARHGVLVRPGGAW